MLPPQHVITCLSSKVRLTVAIFNPPKHPSWTDLMKEYRKLDDSIPMRLNRTIAQYRDMDRTGSAGKGTVEDQACLQVWRELIGPFVHLPWDCRTCC